MRESQVIITHRTEPGRPDDKTVYTLQQFYPATDPRHGMRADLYTETNTESGRGWYTNRVCYVQPVRALDFDRDTTRLAADPYTAARTAMATLLLDAVLKYGVASVTATDGTYVNGELLPR